MHDHSILRSLFLSPSINYLLILPHPLQVESRLMSGSEANAMSRSHSTIISGVRSSTAISSPFVFILDAMQKCCKGSTFPSCTPSHPDSRYLIHAMQAPPLLPVIFQPTPLTQPNIRSEPMKVNIDEEPAVGVGTGCGMWDGCLLALN